MAKGSQAKEVVIKKIASAFGDNYVGEYDKKVYVMAPENGELVQIAISLTCPKTPITFNNTVLATGDFNFEDDAPATITVASSVSEEPVVIDDQERKNIEDMMARLGL